jgi:hypothetical protein
VLVNIMALAVSIVSLAVSGIVALRQVTVMRHANQLPIFIELTQEHRSAAFQGANDRVMSVLADSNLRDRDVSSLPDETRAAFTRVAAFFITLGAMVVFGVVHEAMVVHLFGYRATKAWQAMEPIIKNERVTRRGGRYAAMFEDLVTRTCENWPPGEAYGTVLRAHPKIDVVLGHAEDSPQSSN